MNPAIVRLLPPLVVLTVAVWSGWPAPQPGFADTSSSAAKAARWKPSDLEVRTVSAPVKDPFNAKPKPKPASVNPLLAALLNAKPKGPQPPKDSELQELFLFSGVGSVGDAKWAIVNGRPRNVGAELLPRGRFHWPCTLVALADKHAVVKCGPTTANIRQSSQPLNARSRAVPSAIQPTVEQTTEQPELPALPPILDANGQPVNMTGVSS